MGEARAEQGSADRAAGGEHAGIRVGRMGPTGARRSGRGTVSGRSGFGARLFKSAGDNGGEVRAEPVQPGRRRAFVSDWRPGEVAGGWDAGVSGASGSAGEGAWVSDRAGGD